MTENGISSVNSSGTDSYGVWLGFSDGVRRYVHVFTAEDIARQIRIYGEDWVEKIADLRVKE